MLLQVLHVQSDVTYHILSEGVHVCAYVCANVCARVCACECIHAIRVLVTSKTYYASYPPLPLRMDTVALAQTQIQMS